MHYIFTFAVIFKPVILNIPKPVILNPYFLNIMKAFCCSTGNLQQLNIL